jgi:hypothetical protein
MLGIRTAAATSIVLAAPDSIMSMAAAHIANIRTDWIQPKGRLIKPPFGYRLRPRFPQSLCARRDAPGSGLVAGHEIGLAQRHAFHTQDAVAGGDVEIHIRQHPVVQIILADEIEFGIGEFELDLAVF